MWIGVPFGVQKVKKLKKKIQKLIMVPSADENFRHFGILIKGAGGTITINPHGEVNFSQKTFLSHPIVD